MCARSLAMNYTGNLLVRVRVILSVGSFNFQPLSLPESERDSL